MAHPLIALLTDFGLSDHYVGTMKGVMLGICPDARLVDITHGVPPFDIVAGAFELAAAVRYFPVGTVFLAVVDPAVGSSRRALAVEADRRFFVAPDNGILTPVLDTATAWRAVELREARYALSEVSRTFEGRDRFAPAAAWLAGGAALATLGPGVEDPIRLAHVTPQRQADGAVGAVVRVDRFGNAITNIDARLVAELAAGNRCVVQVNDRRSVPLVGTYVETPAGEGCALIGSSGYLEVAVTRGSAADVLGARLGSVVRISRIA